MKKTYQNHRGFTLTEILVTITILIVLALLSTIGVNRIRETARRSASANNLRQFGVAVTSFVADNNGYMPASRTGSFYWPQVVWSNLESLDVFLIPKTPDRPMDWAKGKDGWFDGLKAETPEKRPIRWNYVINGGAPDSPFAELGSDGKGLATIKNGISRPFRDIVDPTRTVMMAEGNGAWWINNNGAARIRTWSNGSSNILWCDGSLQSLNPKKDLRAEHFKVTKTGL